MNATQIDKIAMLKDKGVKIISPESVFIDQEVSVDRVAGDGVVIYPGCRIVGKETLVMTGAKLGHEGPVTVENCQIGPQVELKGGFYKKSTFLEGSNMGSGAWVREGCLIEEQAGGAHSVGLKQTILLPFVTLGSLINFCDCLMGGGTSRKNHSEVGSSYIHFNYTPNQDKATPSLIGDVPKGVMLNQLPIFLGGQGGMVGPVRISYGTVIAAGIVCRKDILAEGRLLLGQDPPQPYKDVASPSIDFHPGIYWHVKRQVVNNLHFIANLVALRHWYVKVRSMFVQDEPLAQDLHKGAIQKLDMAIEERTKRFRGLAEKMPESINRMQSLLKKQTNQRLMAQKQEFFDRWQDLENLWEKNIDDGADNADLEAFLMALQKRQKESSSDYITAIRGLHEKASQQGTKWLQSIVDTMNHEALEILPSFRNG